MSFQHVRRGACSEWAEGCCEVKVTGFVTCCLWVALAVCRERVERVLGRNVDRQVD